jgi:cell division protein FtsQ
MNWKRTVGWVVALLFGVVLTEYYLRHQLCKEVVIHIDHESGVRFLETTDIERLLAQQGTLQSRPIRTIELDKIEEHIEKNPLIYDCQAHVDLRGNVILNITQQKPVARWVPGSTQSNWQTAKGMYINSEGSYFALSEKFSAQVPLVSGDFFKKITHLRTEKAKPILELLLRLHEDPFWNTQVTQIYVYTDGEVELYTLLGNQRIEFGRATDLDVKFKKLRIYYDQLLFSDWNKYSRVNVKFKNQIICE